MRVLVRLGRMWLLGGRAARMRMYVNDDYISCELYCTFTCTEIYTSPVVVV